MDNKISELSLLIQNNKEKYPNLCKLWEKYLDNIINNCNNELNIGIQRLNSLNTIERDLTFKEIISLIVIYDSIYDVND